MPRSILFKIKEHDNSREMEALEMEKKMEWNLIYNNEKEEKEIPKSFK